MYHTFYKLSVYIIVQKEQFIIHKHMSVFYRKKETKQLGLYFPLCVNSEDVSSNLPTVGNQAPRIINRTDVFEAMSLIACWCISIVLTFFFIEFVLMIKSDFFENSNALQWTSESLKINVLGMFLTTSASNYCNTFLFRHFLKPKKIAVIVIS